MTKTNYELLNQEQIDTMFTVMDQFFKEIYQEDFVDLDGFLTKLKKMKQEELYVTLKTILNIIVQNTQETMIKQQAFTKVRKSLNKKTKKVVTKSKKK